MPAKKTDFDGKMEGKRRTYENIRCEINTAGF